MIVPEIMSGRSQPSSSQHATARHKIAAFAFRVSNTVSMIMQINATEDERARRLA